MIFSYVILFFAVLVGLLLYFDGRDEKAKDKESDLYPAVYQNSLTSTLNIPPSNDNGDVTNKEYIYGLYPADEEQMASTWKKTYPAQKASKKKKNKKRK